MPKYAESTRSTAPFGPPSNRSKYTFSATPDFPVTHGWVSTYDGGGFTVLLDDASAAQRRRQVATLMADGWVDEQTRAVIVGVDVFNANVNSLLNMVFIIEMNAGGGFVPWYRFRAFRAFLYLSAADRARAVAEVTFVVGLLAWIVYTLRQMARRRHKGESILLWFVQPWWNLVDTVNKLMLALSVVFEAQRRAALADFNRRLAVAHLPAGADDVEALAALADFQYGLTAANLFVSMLTIFKYLDVNKRMSLLGRTLVKAAGDLLTFLVFFGIVFGGFAITSHLSFGSSLYQFRTLGRSFTTLFKMLLGDFDYEEMEERGNRVLAPLFFILYIGLVFFVLVNVFLAIINDAYADVHDSIKASKTLGQSLRAYFRSRVLSVSHFTSHMRALDDVQPSCVMTAIVSLALSYLVILFLVSSLASASTSNVALCSFPAVIIAERFVDDCKETRSFCSRLLTVACTSL